MERFNDHDNYKLPEDIQAFAEKFPVLTFSEAYPEQFPRFEDDNGYIFFAPVEGETSMRSGWDILVYVGFSGELYSLDIKVVDHRTYTTIEWSDASDCTLEEACEEVNRAYDAMVKWVDEAEDERE